MWIFLSAFAPVRVHAHCGRILRFIKDYTDFADWLIWEICVIFDIFFRSGHAYSYNKSSDK